MVGVDGDLPWYKDIKVNNHQKKTDYVEAFEHVL